MLFSKPAGVQLLITSPAALTPASLEPLTFQFHMLIGSTLAEALSDRLGSWRSSTGFSGGAWPEQSCILTDPEDVSGAVKAGTPNFANIK